MVLIPLHMDITKATWFENRVSMKVLSIEKMPNRNGSREVMISMGRSRSNRVVCCFCKKVLTKKEVGMHVYVCEKVPQEILNLSLQNALGR